MKAKVFFIASRNKETTQSIAEKFNRLIEASGLISFIEPDNKIAVKLHFGEQRNKGYVRPEYVRVAVDHIVQRQACAFLADTNTLYRGRRMNSKDHLELAYEHGFTSENVKGQVIIPDDTLKENIQEVEVNAKYVKTAKIAKLFYDADGIIDIAHFKGHLMTGFGGALKNLGMGCATREGKLMQHSHLAPFIIPSKCTGCQACYAVCPVQAVIIKGKKAFLDSAKCIGCASCIAACKYNAVELSWEAGGALIQERMVEYAKAVLMNKKDKLACFNFLIKITQECDCLAKDDPRIVPDIGILASIDPVAIDKAGFDLVSKAAKKDIFKKLHPKRDGIRQLSYAEELGLGSMDYELVSVSP
jgi:hypothetical protein